MFIFSIYFVLALHFIVFENFKKTLLSILRSRKLDVDQNAINEIGINRSQDQITIIPKEINLIGCLLLFSRCKNDFNFNQICIFCI